MALHLHLLRHADAGDPLTWAGPDAARPLSDEGTEQARRLARHLAAIRFTCDALLSSPKRRALETAEPVAVELGLTTVVDDRLAGPLTLPTIAGLLQDAGDPRRPVLVGHDPDFSDLLSELVGANLDMKKGSLARLEIRGELEAGSATLRWLLPPDVLRPR